MENEISTRNNLLNVLNARFLLLLLPLSPFAQSFNNLLTASSEVLLEFSFIKEKKYGSSNKILEKLGTWFKTFLRRGFEGNEKPGAVTEM